jgi:hypothetical protein
MRKQLASLLITLCYISLVIAQDTTQTATDIAQLDIAQMSPDTTQQDTAQVPSDTTQQDTAQAPSDTTQQDTAQVPSDTTQQDTTQTPSDTTQQDTTQAPSDTTQQDTTEVPPETENIIMERRMEIGLMFGEPTGVSYKFFFNPVNAVDAAVAVTFTPDPAFQIHADYLRHFFKFTNVGSGRFPLVYGLGLAVQFQDETTLGIRIPFGLTYFFDQFPVSLFIDVAPRIDIAPEAGISLNASVGIRYRFFQRES